jgi:hypothetical protein
MKYFYIFFILSAILIFGTDQTINAQGPITQTIDDKYGRKNYHDNATNTNYEIQATVHVDYESPSTILISGHFFNSVRGGTNTFNTDLWQAMDLVRSQYGFKLQNVITGGAISVNNPITVFILMTK